MVATKRPTRIQSLKRAIDILELLEWCSNGLALSQIAGHLNLHPSTVHHLLETLRECGYVREDVTTHRYYLGYKTLHLASGFMRELNLHSIALPHLEALCNACHERVLLRILVVDGLITIAKVTPDRAIALHTSIEHIRAAHANSSGKVLLAALSPGERRAFLARVGIPRLTPNTITDVEGLEQELVRVAAQGYAVGRGEMDEGICGVAAPIRDRPGTVVAAVSVAIPCYRFTPEFEAWLIQEVPKTAQRISDDVAHADPEDSHAVHRFSAS